MREELVALQHRDAVPELGDHEVALLVHRAGGTPVYAYRRDALRAAVSRVRAASPTGARIAYSLKANPHPGLVTFLAGLVDGFDVCSLAELETALDAGMAADDVLMTGPAKSRHEAAATLAAGVAVTIESPRQAALFADVARQLDVPGRAVVRLNAPYPAKGSGGMPTPNQFGVGAQDVPEVVERLRDSPMALVGLHLFWGSQYFDAETIVRARTAALERAVEVVESFNLDLDMVAIGGGIGMPWRDGDPAVDWDGLVAASGEPLPVALGPRTEIVCEYGRAIAGQAGSLVTTVLDIKVVGERRYVLVDAGMNHVMIASRLLAGHGRGEPRVRVIGADAGPRTPATVTGPLCSQLDILAEDVLLPGVEVGDLLIFSGVGAYGPTFSPSGFLSREAVQEIVL